MATEIQKGQATLQGIKNDGTTIDIDYDAFIDTAKMSHDWKEETVEDNDGFDAGWSARNAKKECDIVLVPKGANRAAVHASTILLEPLATVPFSHFAVAEFNANWIYQGGSIDLSHGTGKVSLKFRKYDDTDQQTSYATDVT
jgi:hypothetical protein